MKCKMMCTAPTLVQVSLYLLHGILINNYKITLETFKKKMESSYYDSRVFFLLIFKKNLS